ncbi:MAG: TetR/AcrR family transcriptional regulator [Filifactor alocis]|nr:TetR/AcrR family transcriptional regulator [Filifactor alocis]
MPKIINNVREHILEEASRILRTQGKKSLNIRSIAHSCDIGVGTFYNYFPSKAELFLALYEEELKNFCIRIKMISAQDIDFEQKMEQTFQELSKFFNVCEAYQIHTVKSKDDLLRESIGNQSIFSTVEAMIESEEEKGGIHTAIAASKLTEFILSNLVYLYQRPYMNFEQLYSCFNFFVKTPAGRSLRNYSVVS